MRNRGYLQEEKKTKSGKKRFFIKKQNKVSNLDDQFEEVVPSSEERRSRDWRRKLVFLS